MLTDAFSVIFLVALLIGGPILIWFLIRQSKAKGRWGFGSLRGKACPRCGTALPMFRKPSSPEEALWGGWTCSKCGCKVDKYGRERAPS